MTRTEEDMAATLEGLMKDNPGCMLYVDPKGTGRITLVWARHPDPAKGLFDTPRAAMEQARAQSRRRTR